MFAKSAHKIVQMFCDSRVAANYAELPLIDFCYIDANHTFDAIVADSQTAVTKCRKGGIVVWHDYKAESCVETIVALRYLSKQHHWKICHVARTWLALMIVE